jgi:hypothetical protein
MPTATASAPPLPAVRESTEARAYAFSGNRAGVPTPRDTEEGSPQSAADLQEQRAHRWALATRYDLKTEIILISGACAVCYKEISRKPVVEGNLLIVTPWAHHVAATHPAVLSEVSE